MKPYRWTPAAPDFIHLALSRAINEMESARMLRVTTETKAVLNTEGTGRVIGFVKSSEPGKISLAIPADRAVMTPAQARQLAAWLNEEAARSESTTSAQRTDEGWRRAERERRDAIRSALGTDRVTFGEGVYRRRG